MKLQPSTILKCFLVYGFALYMAASRSIGQTEAGLQISLFPGLTITGAVGTVYSIEYTTSLPPTNSWRCLEFLQLPSSPFLWMDPSTSATGRRFYRSRAFSASTDMVFIPPGTFRMGSPTNEADRNAALEGPQTAVTITRGFWMGKHEVTQAEFIAVRGYNPSAQNDDLRRPVEMVIWDDAQAYCAQLTEQDRSTGRIPINSVYRLPTEAEWEYACRAWTSTRFGYGEDPGYTNLTDYAWYFPNGSDGTHPVGQKLPNLWGLYDMHGNVYEWCQDWFSEQLPSGIDPQGAATGSFRIARGGGGYSPGALCRSAYRNFLSPYARLGDTGFRVVLAPD